MNQPDVFSVVAAVLALVLLVDVSILWITGRQVPELLSHVIFGVFGFYFGRAPGIGQANGAHHPARRRRPARSAARSSKRETRNPQLRVSGTR